MGSKQLVMEDQLKIKATEMEKGSDLSHWWANLSTSYLTARG
jgi:hypothetical protein